MSAGSPGEDDDRCSDESVGGDGGVGDEDVAADSGGDVDARKADGTPNSGGTTAGTGAGVASDAAVADLRDRVDALRRDLESFEVDVEERTVHRSEIESELRRYVRGRLRRGHARGWGPYLVLLYGTAMTLGAFYLLSGGWAILAMLVIWLSTLGLYALMLVVGVLFEVVSLPGRAAGWVRNRRR